MWKALLVVTFFIAKGNTNDCVPRSFGTDRIVCVCNATYCDTTPDNNPKVPARGRFYWYVSSREGLRMRMTEGQVGPCEQSPCSVTLTIDTTKRYQRIQGFGGAFTDSAGINIRKLSAATQDQLIRTYFDPNAGSKYTLGRVPIGGTDFSTRPYTYDDYENDTRLEHFALQQEDYDYKIPYMQRALELNPETKFVAVAWSPPTWMKTNNRINGFGFLKTEYYGLYSDYLLKFMDEYKNNGLDIWAVTTGNEPIDAFVPFDLLNTMGWTPQTMGDWVANYFGPALARSQHRNTQILALDDQRLQLPWFIRNLFQNTKAERYIAGTAVHWYTDFIVPPTVLDSTHNSFPNKFILMTEACTGSGLLEYPKVILGSWKRGVSYILSIIEYMNHWSVGWIDWNLALDDSGGPNWIRNFVDSPIIVNQETDEFYKNPMYYALMHFSRFVERNSVRISISQADNIKSTAFVTPSHEVVVVLYNEANSTRVLSLRDLKRGSICVTVPPNSMNTIIYRE
ncbi:lysosomal acid glucosylceramidase-like [Hylaeus anthracinus]|uniref:lysosomal acid glucosylceramidase-like n=1 Tax=Hylaeus anthracinus TaxID=313031 RepID=UPI0023B9AFA9|nr:lysosomal acid glucosylceramidase-like [Hylaeus anthracinus]XP_053995685.1 lysosomal acid glucosylceramidase-like [Hylaeus anthracinus]